MRPRSTTSGAGRQAVGRHDRDLAELREVARTVEANGNLSAEGVRQM
jgi:hypothetical protein